MVKRLLLFATLQSLTHSDTHDQSIQTFDFSRSQLFFLVVNESFYSQLSMIKFYYSKHVSAKCNFVRSRQLQLPFLSSSEPSSGDDIDPHLEIVLVRQVFLVQPLRKFLYDSLVFFSFVSNPALEHKKKKRAKQA